MLFKRYIKEAFNPLILKRALRVALIVGVILNLINQGESVFSGFKDFHLMQFLLTFIVPYIVSTYSSVLSKFNFVSGEVAGFDAHISCKGCGEASVKVQKGDVVPYCPGCEVKTKWNLKKLLPPDTFLEEDKTKSNALFAEFNPAPVIRVDNKGHILRANPTARMLFNIDEKENHIIHYINDLKGLDFEEFIRSNRVKTFQISINEDYYQLDLRAIAELEVFHIYASKNTQLIAERNQHLLFQNAMEKTSDSVMITNTKSEIEYVNRAFEEHSGYTLKDVKGKNPRILNSGHQGPEVYKELWETIESGEIWKGLFRNKKKNGDLYWERATITSIIQDDGSIWHYMAIKDDVTEELKLKEELKSFALFARHNPDFVMRFDADLSVIEANPAATAILKAENVIGQSAADLIPELKEINIDSLIENNRQKSIRINVDQDYFNLVVKGIKELNLIHVYGSNITEQAKAEKVIESMALFARLNPEPVFRFDSEFTVIDANPAATETFPELRKGNDIRQVIQPFEEIYMKEFIRENGIMNREEKINDHVYRFMLRGISNSDVCQVYSSDITKRVEQEQKIKVQAEKIQSSIQYASSIQEAVLPHLDYIGQVVPEHMMLYLPRDVVSGDFYWIKKVEDSIVIAIADCTGHGVPGAFMSMLGVAFLNEIVKPGNLKANEILNQLRDYVIRTLSNSSDSRADGMDMALCIIQPENKTIQYAGANNPFILINKSGLTEIKADRMPIGKYIKQDKPFTLHEIPCSKDDTVYLFSDGYRDQLGGPDLLKYGSKNFKKLLIDIHEKDFDEQKQILTDEFNNWSKDYHPIDDVLVMGFKLP
ncbi:MAG: nitrate/nitrite transporter NrtS [Bacteroidota bacterium]|nr:nitrate/nitrite transporter NrtS [Bacteroidota bacterium]